MSKSLPELMADMLEIAAKSPRPKRRIVKADEIAEAIRDAFISPNVHDSNLEPANLVDCMHGLVKAARRIADALEADLRARDISIATDAATRADPIGR